MKSGKKQCKKKALSIEELKAMTALRIAGQLGGCVTDTSADTSKVVGAETGTDISMSIPATAPISIPTSAHASLTVENLTGFNSKKGGISMQELKDLTQMRLSRETLDSHPAVGYEGDPSFENAMWGDLRSKRTTPDTDCMSEQSSRSSVGGPTQKPLQIPAVSSTGPYSSRAKQQEQHIQGGVSSTTYLCPVPIHSLLQPVPVSVSNRSMRVGPPILVSCPSAVIEGSSKEINPESQSAPPDALLSKYGPMGFRKSLLKFLDSDSDLSDLDISRHSKGGSLDVSSHSLGRSNNGNRSNNGKSLSLPPFNDLSDGILDINVEPRVYAKSQGLSPPAFHRKVPVQSTRASFVSSDNSSESIQDVNLEPRVYLKSQRPSASASHIKVPVQPPIRTFRNRSALSSQYDSEDPLDVCRHGDIKP